MESSLVLIAERYFAFKHLTQFGGKSEDKQIQRQNRHQDFAHAVFSAFAVPDGICWKRERYQRFPGGRCPVFIHRERF